MANILGLMVLIVVYCSPHMLGVGGEFGHGLRNLQGDYIVFGELLRLYVNSGASYQGTVRRYIVDELTFAHSGHAGDLGRTPRCLGHGERTMGEAQLSSSIRVE